MVFTTSGRSPFLQSKRSICDAFWLLARRCNVTPSHRYHRVNRTSSRGGKTWVFSGRMLTSWHEGLNRCVFTKYPSFKFALHIPGVVCNGSMPLQILCVVCLVKCTVAPLNSISISIAAVVLPFSSQRMWCEHPEPHKEQSEQQRFPNYSWLSWILRYNTNNFPFLPSSQLSSVLQCSRTYSSELNKRATCSPEPQTSRGM